jgi:hypothetical protein
MNIEKAVLELTDNINHAGLNEQLINERELFLCLVTVIFINIIENKKYDELLKVLFEFEQNESNLEKLSNKLISFNFVKSSHRAVYQELTDRLQQISVDKQHQVLSKTSHLPSLELIQSITKKEAIVTYGHILQRIQGMNMVDKLSSDFEYQDIPSCFAEIVSKLVNKTTKHSIYDPYAMTGELVSHYASLNQVGEVITETVLQLSSYLKHLFSIAGVEDIKTLYSFSLSSGANIKPMIADVAFTLLDPTASKDDEKLQKEADDEPMLAVADKRIKDKTVPAKFKEHGFVQQLIYSLKDNGTAIIFLGKGPLHREIEKNARAFLIDNNFVDAVIELPSKLIKPRTVSLYALVLKKGRTDNLVKFINASDCYEAVGRVNKLAKLDDIYELYNSKNSVSSRMVLKEVNQVVANDYLLIPSSYLSDFKTTSNSIDLKEIRVQLLNQAEYTDKKLGEIFAQLSKK